MSDLAIRVEGLGKEYHIGALQRDRYRTFGDAFIDAITAPARRARLLLSGRATGAAELDQSLWALRDIGFEVKSGEVVGVIGRNGTGKSTLLKILSRITEPTTGFAEIHGRVGSLLEVGTGFHPELTGRENVFLNGAILGMSRAEIRAKFDEIVAFSEIEKFIDTPVKHYSTGMGLRLAFAVAAHMDPEILIVDEVLAVGDASFRRKCLGKMGEVAHEGRTVLMVSHNMSAITQLCERAILLSGGEIVADGPPQEVVAEYLSVESILSGERVWKKGFSNPGADEFKFDAIRVLGADGQVTTQLDSRLPFCVELEYRVEERLPVSRVGVLLDTPDGITLFDSYDSDDERFALPREPGRYTSSCTVPGNLLSPGKYLLSINAGIPGVKNLASLQSALSLEIVNSGAAGSLLPGNRRGLLRPALEWEQRVSLQ